MTNLLEQAINCEDGDLAAKIIQDALGIENADMIKYCFGKTWPADRGQRARIIGEWLQLEARLQANTHIGEMAGSQDLRARVPDERQLSCFALEEEKGGIGRAPRRFPLSANKGHRIGREFAPPI